MRFLFCLDLSLHAGAGKKIWNLELCIQTRPKALALIPKMLLASGHTPCSTFLNWGCYTYQAVNVEYKHVVMLTLCFKKYCAPTKDFACFVTTEE